MTMIIWIIEFLEETKVNHMFSKISNIKATYEKLHC